MFNDIKLKITSFVTQWEVENANMLLAFIEARKIKTATLKDKYGEIGDYIERILYEIPEDLDIYLNRNLNGEDKEFLKSKVGGQWFAKTFMQYNVSQKN